jgi:hypothetical protein
MLEIFLILAIPTLAMATLHLLALPFRAVAWFGEQAGEKVLLGALLAAWLVGFVGVLVVGVG